ncbi:enterochelin esterase [Virgisporangium aliadipatigenens]|uniref:Enterochelin esterase n=1 Tax=Virgisporangium aliadipatigenens TaxID=741659 RepID=A0A8J3YH56_9ACTN|nr:alpha/beta hydrolase-fold protein [Virgisporangium aliadipatigenens]GIJ43920.1 enterochelin esterase [Virgisporangium aliadipatigenens]
MPWSHEFAGRLDEHTIDSALLRDNPLGDPAQRPLWVYVPPGYDEEPRRRYPSVYVIQGYTGHLAMWRNRSAYRQPFPETADALFASGDAPPCVVVYVDAWTAYGGSQFVDSPGTGKYHSYLCDEVVPFVDARYRTLDAAAHRGVSGKSSGGFGALITPMLRPDLFGGLASHAGDSLYEYAYLHEFALATRALRDHYEGSYEKFWADFRSRPAFTKEHDGTLVMVYGCAAAFSADADGTVRLPFDPVTGQLVPQAWQRWLDWDPVRMIPKYADALRGLKAIYLDAGKRDEWFLDLGHGAVRAELAKIGVTDVHHELFEGTHMAIDYRYPIGLRYLAERLAPAS